jgi:ABC-type nitrate/sulfonate/bicarbonate transport system ATPase subunit
VEGRVIRNDEIGTGNSGAHAIRLEDVGRSFRRADGRVIDAVSAVTLEIEKGEFVCLIGPSGCGKTTLLQMVAGLTLPSSGRILVHGRVVKRPGPERGVVFQKDSVFPWMRVIDNVEYGLRCRGIDKATRRSTARRYLEAVGLTNVERSWPRELSGGMLKRVAVATVFANGASVLLLDEPFGALDYVTKRQLHSVLLDLWTESNSEAERRTVLFVTHDVDEALILADRILVMREGWIVEDVGSFLPRPRTIDVLAEPEAVDLKHVLLRHLGLSRAGRPIEAAASASSGEP